MRESLICTGRVAGQAFCFPETGIRVYSYEELCYYMKDHMVFYLHTLPEEELAVWIREELRLEKLYRTLIKYDDPSKDQMKYFAALFREGTYFSEEEIRGILDSYRVLKNASRFSQCKWIGDLFYSEDRAGMAVRHYQEALKEDGVSEADRGAVHHNLGSALTRLFRFQDARIHYLKAYQYAGDEKSLYMYYAIIALTKGLDQAGKELEGFEISDLVVDSFERDYALMRDSFQWSDGAAFYRKLYLLSSQGREEECNRVKNRYIRNMQKDFRKQLSMPDNLFVLNAPANI